MLSRGKTLILIEGERRMKVCECKSLFPVEYNTRGQMTSRALCDSRWRRPPSRPNAKAPAAAARNAMASGVMGMDSKT